MVSINSEWLNQVFYYLILSKKEFISPCSTITSRPLQHNLRTIVGGETGEARRETRMNYRAALYGALYAVLLFFVLLGVGYIIAGSNKINSLSRFAENAEKCVNVLNASACSDGNACNAPILTPICPQDEFRRDHDDDHDRDRHEQWGWRASDMRGGNWGRDDNKRHHRKPPCDGYVCELLPMPNGACCAKNDVCFGPSPNKTCFFGQCIAQNLSLCRGACQTDSDCINSTTPFPIYPTAEPDILCLRGSCLAVVTALSTVIVPTDLLNLTTAAAVAVAACLEMNCFITTGEGNAYVCEYAWKCSQLLGFNDQSKKRAIYDGNEQSQIIYANFSLPWKGQLTRAQYIEVNAELNSRVAHLFQNGNK
jgi:hypothetical protein